jgi:hypothetical protein
MIRYSSVMVSQNTREEIMTARRGEMAERRQKSDKI